jgi:UDP-glucose 4-epimerase
MSRRLKTQTHLILGGSGFIGRHVALRLATLGHKVILADRLAPPTLPGEPRKGAIDYVAFDLNSADWDGVIAHSDVVHHYLWTSTPRTAAADPHADLQANVGATISLLESLRRHRGKRLVFTSSGGTVYGRLRSTPVTEDHPLDPISAYGTAKVAAEKYIGLFRAQDGVDGRIARLANPFGVGQDFRNGLGAVAVFLEQALNGETISIWGDGSIVRDYIHIADAAEALTRLSLAPTDPTPETPVFNVGSGEGRSLNDVIDAIRSVLVRPVAVHYNDARPFDVPISVLDISRAKARLDWCPRLSFEDGLARMHEDIAAGRRFYSRMD